MQQFVIAGGKPLHGEVTLAGSKNLASKLMLASLLTSETCELTNVPDIGENQLAEELLRLTGATVKRDGTTLRVNGNGVSTGNVASAPKNRLPILIAAPLLFRTGEASVPEPGGDKIGRRPVNLHLDLLRQMGVQITEGESVYHLSTTGLRAADITLPYPSVGATETALLATVGAKGKSVIRGAAIEPEILEIVRFLTAMGANIEYTNDREFTIVGVESFHGATQRVIGDRLEGVSYASLALATKGSVTIHGANDVDMKAYLDFVMSIGASVAQTESSLTVAWQQPLMGGDIVTGVHPGFMSDWQQPATVMLLTAQGHSTVHETVHDRRFGYIDQLNQMGATIRVEDTTSSAGVPPFVLHETTQIAHIEGPTPLRGAELTMPDLRAGMAYIIAALVADGQSNIGGIDQVDRGYEHIDVKLKQLGATIERVEV